MPHVVIEAFWFVSEVGNKEIQKSIPVIVAKIQAHPALRPAISVKRGAVHLAHRAEATTSIVLEIVLHLAIVRHVQVISATRLGIGEGDTEAFTLRLR